jgi:thymidylate synthase (FAD)
MRLIKPSYEIIEQGPGLQGIYDIIERCGKISYKSEPKGGEVAKRFVEARAKEKHGAVLEFGTVYLQKDVNYDDRCYWEEMNWSEFYKNNPHSKVVYRPQTKYGVVKKTGEPVSTAITTCYITTNYRVLVENNRLDDLKYLCEPTEYHEKRYTVKFIADIGVGREFLRHRVMSPVQESTRYVNYMKEKFGEQCTFVIPPWINLPECEDLTYWDGDWVDMKKMKIVYPGKKSKTSAWLWAMDFAEKQYRVLTNDWSDIEGVDEEDKAPWTAQQARTVLPLSTKAEFALCGFTDAWIHFFRLRSDIAATGKPHPQAQELANPLREEFLERKYVTKESLEYDSFEPFDVVISDTPLKD